VGTPPLRTFREVLYLRFAADGLAQEIALDPANAVFQASFQPREYNALQPGAPLAQADVSTPDGAFVVELDAPRRLLFVKLKAPGLDFTLSVHRLDGQAIAEKPTATAAQSPDQTFHFDFTDARFALRLRDPGGQNVSLAFGDVAAVNVQADPAGPRIGIVLLPDPAEPGADPLAAPALFWPPPGDAVPTVVDAGPALAETLERQLARLSALPAPPAHVDAALVITADAPCELLLQALAVPYRLVSHSLGSEAAKEVLRFAGAGAADRSITLQLPGGAKVVSATLETMPSLRVDRPVSGGAGTAVEEPVEQTGARIDGRVWVAQRVTPPQAVTVLGIAVGLLGLNRDAELTLELREDHQGEPTGRTLAEGSLTLGPAGRRAWSTVFLSAPVILPAQPCWLLLTAAEGEAVWLTRSGETGIRILGRSVDRSEKPAARNTGVEGMETLHRLLIAEDRQAATSETAPLLELRLKGSPVPELSAGESDRKIFDLAAALTSYLAGRPATSPQVIPLDFTSAVPGSLTVYPPRITYEPG
jgi:hypothetical protein